MVGNALRHKVVNVLRACSGQTAGAAASHGGWQAAAATLRLFCLQDAGMRSRLRQLGCWQADAIAPHVLGAVERSVGRGHQLTGIGVAGGEGGGSADTDGHIAHA